MYVYKTNARGYLIKYKVRLVIRGDEEAKLIEDNYTVILATKSFRILIALVAQFDLNTV